MHRALNYIAFVIHLTDLARSSRQHSCIKIIYDILSTAFSIHAGVMLWKCCMWMFAV